MTSNSGSQDVVRVDAWHLRCLLKRSGYLERVRSGDIETEIRREQPARSQYKQPPGSVSQEVYYYDGLEQVAKVHQFVLPDGTIGASGLPNPKRLRIDGVTYRIHQGDDPVQREPELRYKHVWQRKLYGRWRKLKCWLIGR